MAYGRRRTSYSNSNTRVYIHTCVDSDGVTQVHLSGSETRPNVSIATAQFSAAVNIIKSVVSGKRRYDDTTKVWYIDNDYWAETKEDFQVLSFTTIVPYATEDDFEAFIQGREKVRVKWDGPENKAAQDFFHNFNTAILKVADTTTDKVMLANLLGLASFDNIPSDKLAAKKLYRAAAIKHHPDKNAGDGHNMTELNRLWGVYVQPTL